MGARVYIHCFNEDLINAVRADSFLSKEVGTTTEADITA
jgi:hypothetical protein